jgi:hypothetical protein
VLCATHRQAWRGKSSGGDALAECANGVAEETAGQILVLEVEID